MLISDKHFTEFKKLYRKEFGEEAYNKMTEQQLLESATKLLRLVEIVYRHKDSKENLDEAYDVLFKETERQMKNEK